MTAPPGQGPPDTPGAEDNPPPFWGSWGRIYLLIAGLLLVETALFWWLTRWAA